MYFNLDEKGQGRYRENDRTSVFVSFKMGQENILSKKKGEKGKQNRKERKKDRKGANVKNVPFVYTP